MRWMNLEPVIQSDVSQKEKEKYCILMHIYIYIYVYMEFRKMVLMVLHAGQQRGHSYKEQTFRLSGESEGGMV